MHARIILLGALKYLATNLLCVSYDIHTYVYKAAIAGCYKIVDYS